MPTPASSMRLRAIATPAITMCPSGLRSAPLITPGPAWPLRRRRSHVGKEAATLPWLHARRHDRHRSTASHDHHWLRTCKLHGLLHHIASMHQSGLSVNDLRHLLINLWLRHILLLLLLPLLHGLLCMCCSALSVWRAGVVRRLMRRSAWHEAGRRAPLHVVLLLHGCLTLQATVMLSILYSIHDRFRTLKKMKNRLTLNSALQGIYTHHLIVLVVTALAGGMHATVALRHARLVLHAPQDALLRCVHLCQ